MVYQQHTSGSVCWFLFYGAPVVHARKPADIIAAELWDHDDPNQAADDVIEALEEAGWRLVWVPDEQEAT